MSLAFGLRVRIICARVLLIGGLISASTLSYGYEFPKASTDIDLARTEKLRAISEGVSEIATKSGKALVFVSVAKVVNMRTLDGMDPFEFFFGTPRQFQQDPRQGRPQAPQQQQRRSGLGSGFLVDLEEGYIITNNHVIDDADEIEVKLANGRTYTASVVGRDKNTDVAVVKIKDEKYDRSGLSTLSFADSDKLNVGDFVIALGAPFGLEASVSFGVISALKRGNMQITDLGDFIQTDAAINPGNSGGPLLNTNGDVVGVNSAIISRTGAYNGIGLAIPSNLARSISIKLVEDGKVSRGFIGVNLQELTDDLKESLSLKKTDFGALVAKVQEGGPADQGGIKEGDVIFKVEDMEVRNPSEVANKVGLLPPGKDAAISVHRKGKPKVLKVQLAEYPDNSAPGQSNTKPDVDLGLNLRPLSSNDRQQYNIDSEAGLVILDINPNSPAAKSNLRPGDVILTLNGKSVKSVADFREHLNKKDGHNLMRVERSGQFMFVSIRGDLG